MQYLEEYAKQLQHEQEKNQKFFNKNGDMNSDIHEQIKNNFFQDSFFSDIFDR